LTRDADVELWTKFLTIILVAICGGIIQRVTGFGFGIFAMMFLPHIVGGLFGSASLMSNLLTTFMTAFVAFRHRKYIQWRIILPCLGASLITTSIAVAFMKKAENEWLELALGVILILLSAYFIFFAKNIKLKASIPVGIILGALSGILGGLFSMSGPPVVLYYLATCQDKDEYISTIQCYFALTGIYNILAKITAGFLTAEVLLLFPFGFIGVLCGNTIGSKIAKKINSDALKTLVYIVMAISGAITFISALRGLI
jgi:uncharacterized membrane protein YfcA